MRKWLQVNEIIENYKMAIAQLGTLVPDWQFSSDKIVMFRLLNCSNFFTSYACLNVKM